MYNIDMEKKNWNLNANPYDFSSVSEQMKKDWNLKNEGTGKVFFKTLRSILMNNEKNKMKGTVYNWQGLYLKSDI